MSASEVILYHHLNTERMISMTSIDGIIQCCPIFLTPRAAEGLILKPRAAIVISKAATTLLEPYELHACIAGTPRPPPYVYEAFPYVADFAEFTFLPLSSIYSITKATTVAKLLCAPVLVGISPQPPIKNAWINC